MTNPKAWRALIARAVEANNEEMAAGTGMSPNQYMQRFVRDGKQAVAREVDGDDTERTAKAERELERQKEPVLVVAHQAVLRALYGYFVGRNREEVPHLDVPLHTIIELTPKAYGCDERRYVLPPGAR